MELGKYLSTIPFEPLIFVFVYMVMFDPFPLNISNFTKPFDYSFFNIRSFIKEGCILKYAWILGLTFNEIFASLVIVIFGNHMFGSMILILPSELSILSLENFQRKNRLSKFTESLLR